MTRDEILDAAAQIFSQKGFHAASMQDIAEAVKLQKASLYHHVSSKQDILLALLDRALDMLIERMQGVIDLPLPSDVKLHRAIQVYLETLIERRDLAAVLLLEHRSLEPEYHAKHIPRRDRFEALWRELLQEGKHQDIFTCPDPALVSRLLLGSLNWTITWYRDDGPLSPTTLADQVTDLFLAGLLTRQEHHGSA
jgi:AcrR family transcriptional regulator